MNRNPLLISLLFWVLLLLAAGSGFLYEQLECALVMFAALLLVPAGLGLLDVQDFSTESRFLFYRYFTVSGLFALAYVLEFKGLRLAFLLQIPYLLLALWYLMREFSKIFLPGNANMAFWIRLFALGYWLTGGVWAFCFLSGIRPLDFDRVIVSLTAAHFHVAGFVLSSIVYAMFRYKASFRTRALALASLLGMPLVAVGISMSKMGFSPMVEWLSALFFAAYALGVVWMQLWLSRSPNMVPLAFMLLRFASLFLLSGAVLAALYGLRFHYPLAWINIPNMKIFHGALNTLGFGALSLAGWSLERVRDSPAEPKTVLF